MVISFMKTEIITQPIGLEHPSVKSVLEIAEEIMNQNKILNVENLYNLAKKRLKLPRRGLLSIIHFLINKKILIEGSKFSKETVLSNRFRYNILRFLRRNFSAHFSMIRKMVVINESGNLGSSGQLIWHLEMLLKFNHIKKIKVGNYTVFLPYEMDQELGIFYFLLHGKINKKIIDLLIERESVKKSEIYKEINEKRENVYYRIKNLIEHNLLIVKKELDNKVFIYPSKREIVKQILKKLE